MLLQVMFAMNCEKSETTRDSAYHLVFGMVPRSHPGTESRLLDEASDVDDVGPNTAETPQSTTSQRPIPAPRTALRHESPTPMTTVCNDNEMQFEQARPVPAPRAPRPVPSVVPDSPENMDDDNEDSVVDELRAQSRQRAHAETLRSAERISNFYNRSRKRQVNSTEKLS